jgi:NAD(P)H-dependent flavin oxidoreductase YrpB (nitropropane dioxygenase family)
VSSAVLASYLARDDVTKPDGFVVEGPVAGGHNAPPRGRLVLADDGEPVYGPRDDCDLTKFVDLGLPFWLAGSYGTPERLAEAQAAGANGVQVGTPFALCEESGLRPELRLQLVHGLESTGVSVRTDVLASPTGFPFKVAQLDGTLSDPAIYEDRQRLCDLGYLRTPYVSEAGVVGYRCPSEPEHMYVRKGGAASETVGRTCLCNALMANVGLAQTRRDGFVEPPLVTLGSELAGVRELALRHPGGWWASDVLDWLLGQGAVTRESTDVYAG